MRNVRRLPKPASLSKNASTWTSQLLAEIKSCSTSGEKIWEKFYDKYNTKDVREALNRMYNNCCCYCESKIGIVDYPHIEHRKPKRSKANPPICYPDLCFDWDNLHLACTKCNISKSDKFDISNPILDAVTDILIENHFTYRLSPDGRLLWWPKSNRAKTTSRDVDINREELARARLTVFCEAYNLLLEIKSNPDNPSNDIAISELKRKANGESPYGSIIKFLLSNQDII